MPDNKLLGVDTSSYPTFAGGNRLMPAPDPVQGASQAVGLLQQLQGLETSKFDLLKNQTGALHNIFASIAADPSMENVATRAAEARRMGIPEASITSAIDEFTKTGGQPEAIRNIAVRHIAQLATVDQHLTLAGRGVPSRISVGDQLQEIQPKAGIDPGTRPTSAAPIPLAMSPEGKAAPRTSVTPTGQTITQPTSNTIDRFGYGRPEGAAPVPPARPVDVPGGGSVPPRAVTPALPPGATVTGLPPGATEAATITGRQSGEALAADRSEAARYRDAAYPLEQAIPALERLGPTGTGPGTETFNHIKSFILSAGLPGVDANKVKDYDEAKKYLTDFVNRNGNTGTNDKLAAAFAGNPSVNISNAAAVDVAKSALALKRMQNVKVAAFEQARQESAATGKPLAEADYSSWARQWSNRQDVRAYGFDMMTKPAQQKLLKDLGGPGKPDYERFMMSLRAAHSAELLQRSR